MKHSSDQKKKNRSLQDKLSPHLKLSGGPPSYKIIGSVVCVDSIKPYTAMNLSRLVASGHVFDHVMVMSCILPNARNENLKYIYEAYGKKDYPEPFTHVLFIDGDMRDIHGTIVNKLFNANVPVIGAVCTKRHSPFTPVINPESLPELERQLSLPEKDRRPFKVDATGLACLLVKKEVLDRTFEITPAGMQWFSNDRRPRDTIIDEFNKILADLPGDLSPEEVMRVGFQLGLTSHINTTIVGEDIAFFDRLKALDIPVYIHPGCFIGHTGDQTFDVRDWINNNPNKKGVGPKVVSWIEKDQEIEATMDQEIVIP